MDKGKQHWLILLCAKHCARRKLSLEGYVNKAGIAQDLNHSLHSKLMLITLWQTWLPGAKE